MLSKNCVRKCSSHRSSLRQPTYSSLSRYQRSMKHRFNGVQHSPSISISDEQQRLTHIALANNVNACEVNGLAKSRNNEQQIQPVVAIRETAGYREYVRSMSRGSDSSQLTMTTSLSKHGLNNEGNNVAANDCLLRIHKPKAVTLGRSALVLSHNVN